MQPCAQHAVCKARNQNRRPGSGLNISGRNNDQPTGSSRPGSLAAGSSSRSVQRAWAKPPISVRSLDAIFHLDRAADQVRPCRCIRARCFRLKSASRYSRCGRQSFFGRWSWGGFVPRPPILSKIYGRKTRLPIGVSHPVGNPDSWLPSPASRQLSHFSGHRG